jgi:hypothetical protein
VTCNFRVNAFASFDLRCMITMRLEQRFLRIASNCSFSSGQRSEGQRLDPGRRACTLIQTSVDQCAVTGVRVESPHGSIAGRSNVGISRTAVQANEVLPNTHNPENERIKRAYFTYRSCRSRDSSLPRINVGRRSSIAVSPCLSPFRTVFFR